MYKRQIINGSNTFFVILVSTIIFRQEKLNLKKIIGCVIGFAGVIVVSMNGQKIDMNLSIMGDGSLFLCALSYAFSSCLMKNYSKKDLSLIHIYKINALSDDNSDREAVAERTFLRLTGGGCHAPVGAHCVTKDNGDLRMVVLFGNDDCSRILRIEVTGTDSEAVGHEAARMLGLE